MFSLHFSKMKQFFFVPSCLVFSNTGYWLNCYKQIIVFRKSARKVAKQNKHDVEESDSEDEDISEEVSDDDDEDDDLSESETERKDDSAIKAKLGKLGSMLKNVKEDDSGDEDDAEDDDDDDADNSNDEDDDSSVENENNQEHGDSDSPEDDIDSEQSEDERKKPDKKVKKSLKRSADQDVVNPKKKKVLRYLMNKLRTPCH